MITPRSLFEPANKDDGHKIGSFILGEGGLVVTSTTDGSKELLDVNVAKIDGLGVYTEDDAVVEASLGQAGLLHRQDTLAVSTSADGDWSYMKATSKGEQYVHDADSIGLLTTIDADTGAIASSVASIDADTTSIINLLTTIDADTGAIATSVASIDADTTSMIGLLTTIDADTGSIDSTLTGLSKARDAVAGAADQGIMALAVRDDAGGSLVGADGDYTPLSINASGELRVAAALSSDVADDEASTENPLLVGAVGVSGALTALSASGDKAQLQTDLYRRLLTSNSYNTHQGEGVETVAGTAVEIDATPSASRQKILIQNNGSKVLYLGFTSGVTATGATKGREIPKGGVYEEYHGPEQNIFVIASAGAGTNNVSWQALG